MLRTRSAFVILALAVANGALAQLPTEPAKETVRVTVSQNDDGSRTAYETDPANKRAVATTTSGGKVISKINYKLDDSGRYESGEVFGANERFQFKTRYAYDPNGRLSEETRLTKEDVVQLKLVYSYDSAGKAAGYSVYDASGKLLGQTRAAVPLPAAPARAATPSSKRSR